LILNLDFINDFIEEATAHLENLDFGLLKLEEDTCDLDNIDGLFRAVHSIKGTAGFFGLKKVVDLSHTMESLFGAVKNQKIEVSKKMIDTLLAATDVLRLLVSDLTNSENVAIDNILQELIAFLSFPMQAETVKVLSKSTSELYEAELHQYHIDINDEERQEIEGKLKRGHWLYLIKLGLNTDLGKKNLNPVMFFKRIESIGNIITSQTDISDIKAIDEFSNILDAELHVAFVFTSVLERGLLPAALEIPAERIIQVNTKNNNPATPQLTPPPTPGLEPKKEEMLLQEIIAPASETKINKEWIADTATLNNQTIVSEDGIRVQEITAPVIETKINKERISDTATIKNQTIVSEDSIRVHVSLLNGLLNLAGELVLGRNQLLRALEKQRKTMPGLDAILQNIDQVTTELQDKVMQTRMQPVGNVFNKFPRIIRDLSQNLGKEIELKLEGIEVELDKSIIEALGDPLTHLVRNAADHGLEVPEIREQMGKYRTGTILLKAYHEGGYVSIDIVDDGAGIDYEKIKRKALEKGIVQESELKVMGEQQLLQLIFKPGFSTAEKVTDFSGRGVGMDVVKTNVEKLGGTVEIFTQPGKGSTFKLLLPLTLAIIPSLIVEVEKQKFALPQVNLEEIARIKPGDASRKIEFIHNAEVLRLRGHLLPIVHLADVLGIKRTYSDPLTGEFKTERRTSLYDQRQDATDIAGIGELPQSRRELSGNIVRLLVIKNGSHRYGIAVDVIHGGEEILVKSLPSFIKDCKCYSGVTILGDGKTAMILDPDGIMEKGNLKFIEEREEKAAQQDLAAQQIQEQQNILLFKCSGPETFGIDMALVSRVDALTVDQIQKIGDLDYIQFRDDSLRIIRPEDFLPVSKASQDNKTYYLIIPKLIRHPMGILIENVIDTVQVNVKLNEENIKTKGLVGSTILNNKIILILNLYELYELADPVHYSLKKVEAISSERTVLVVEDTPFFLKMEKSYLEDAGYTVLTAVNGKEALQILQEKKVDGVVSDIHMPEMDGIELVRRIRADKKLVDLPVIAVTSLNGEAQTQAGMEAGFDYYEYKLDRNRLLEKVGLALSKKKEGALWKKF
jgi:two-component system, chemotaxis family, sensor kinase CheA